MELFWNSIIHPLLRATNARTIIEIGAEKGHNTEHLLAYALECDATVHVIDPVQAFDWDAFRSRSGGRIIFHRGQSLSVLPQLPPCDAVLIDGDHNWYTVFHELRLLEEKTSHSRFPLVLLHDTGWPYGRRDMYHDPEAIPVSFRHAASREGILPEKEKPEREGGINPQFYHAQTEGGPHNGVATALEDFLAQTTLALTRVDVPGFHGLSILLPDALCEHPRIAPLLARMEDDELTTNIRTMEEERIRSWSGCCLNECVDRNEERDELYRQLFEKELQCSRLRRDVQHQLSALRASDRELRKAAEDLADMRALLEREQARLAHILSRRSWRWMHIFRIADVLRRRLLRWFRALRREKRHTPVPASQAAASMQKFAPAIPVTVLPDSWRLSPKEPLLSIIIPVYGHWDSVERCIASVHAETSRLPFEIIVVDDASEEAPPGSLAADPLHTILRNPSNRGFVESCNRGAEAARGRYVVFLNSDTIVTTGWADALLETFLLEPRAGLAGAMLLSVDGRLQEAGGIVFRDGSACNYGRGDDPDRSEYTYLRDADYCSGACIMLPRTLFLELGGFDAKFSPGYYEDTDLAFRVRARGLRVLYQPFARVIHHEGLSAGTDPSRGMKRFQERNRVTFLQLWKSALEAHPLPASDVHAAARRLHPESILVIDVQTPRPDEDSGSLRMQGILLLMKELGYGVTFLPHEPEQHTWRTAALERRGIRMLPNTGPLSLEAHLTAHGKDYAFVLLSRADLASHYIGTVRTLAPQARIIFDTVDLHFVREERTARLLGRSNLLEKARVRKAQELSVARQADCTWVVSDVEKTILAYECPGIDIREVSNIHEVSRPEAAFEDRGNVLFLGNFNHPPNTDAVLSFVGDIFPLIRMELPQAHLLIVGSHPPANIRALESPCITVTGHVPDLRPFFEKTRMTVAPLRFGAGVKGKVHMSLAHGIPVVATSIAAEGMRLAHGRDILIADTPGEFAQCVVALWRNPLLWKTLSTNGMEIIRRFFSSDVALQNIRATFSELKRPRSAQMQPEAPRLRDRAPDRTVSQVPQVRD